MHVFYKSLPTPAGGEASRRLPPTRKHFFHEFIVAAATERNGLTTRMFAAKLVKFYVGVGVGQFLIPVSTSNS